MSAIPLTETAAKRRIGDILLAHGFVSPEQLALATEEQERTQQPLGQILVGHGAITRLELASALAEQWSDPAASISGTARPAPAPAPTPTAQDEALYAARLQEAVADLARKVQSNKPLEGIDERVEELSRRIESTLARTQHIEAAVATLAESLEGVTSGVEEAFYALQTGTADLAAEMARIEQTVGELAAREVPQEDGQLQAELAEVRDALGELRASTSNAELAERLDRIEQQLDAATDSRAELSTRIEELGERVAGPGEDQRVENLIWQLASVEARLDANVAVAADIERLDRESGELRAAAARLDELTAPLARGIVTPEDLASALETIIPDAEVAALRAEIAFLARPDDRAKEANRLAEIELRVESLSQVPSEGSLLDARLDALEKARSNDLDTVNVLAVAMDRIRHDLTTAKAPTEGEPADLLATIAALMERLDALENAPLAAPAPARDDSELAAELERSRLVLERVGLHLGEHDRALADLTPSLGVEERLQELTALVQALAESQPTAAAQPSNGAEAPIPGDIGTLLRRVEEAESASQSDSDKLMNRLERMASSIDWRLQRLETDETDDAE